MDITEESCLDLFPAASVIYLSPDAEEGLTDLNLLHFKIRLIGLCKAADTFRSFEICVDCIFFFS